MTTQPGETIAARIERTLADRIMAGHLAPGTKLRQDHIAEEFDASHVPVREAFRRLEARGLVLGEPRRGVRVAGFTPDDVREVAEMRAALEALALRHAIPHLTRTIIDRAEQINRAGESAGDVQAWEDANRRFHRTLLEPCNMPRLLRAIGDLQDTSARFLFSGWRAEWEAPTDRDHMAILDALRRNQPELAITLLSRHVNRSG